MREPSKGKKQIVNMTMLGLIVLAVTVAIPGFCTGTDVPEYIDPETGFVINDPPVNEPTEKPDVWPPKPLPDPPGISGQSTHTFHI